MDAALFSKSKRKYRLNSTQNLRKTASSLLPFVCIPAAAIANRFLLRTYDSYDIPDMETISTSREAARRSTPIRAQILGNFYK